MLGTLLLDECVEKASLDVAAVLGEPVSCAVGRDFREEVLGLVVGRALRGDS